MTEYTIKRFPGSRIGTLDVGELGVHMHHIASMLEVDVTLLRQKLKEYRRVHRGISFTACLVKTIAHTLTQHREMAGFLLGKRKLILFDDITVSFLVEKEIGGYKVPVPLLLEKVQAMSLQEISSRLHAAREEKQPVSGLVLHRKASLAERIYPLLPAWIRRAAWRFLIKRPRLVFSKMGNVAVTSLGMTGQINGWFVPLSIHPVCFGLGSVMKKPVVAYDNVVIREIMNLSVLMNHDVVDGAPMARFVKDLVRNIECATCLM
jgi:pyruvate/2-oxoglutarate dehydrogenase complex dihydrolipoamide acyltransferase (E2) component